MNFRENLVHLRAVNNMTQEQLAMLLGVSRQSVAKWEAGKSYPEMDKLLSLCRVFNCTLDDLVQGDLTGRGPDAPLALGASAKPEDVFGYDEQMRAFASKVSNGIMSIILGVALCTLFVALGEAGQAARVASPDVFGALGVLVFFAGVAAGLALIIPAGMSHAAFVRAHPFVGDFYTDEERERVRTTFSRELVGGICCIFAGICLVVLLGDTGYEEVVGAPGMLLLVAVGVRFIVHGGMTLGRTNLGDYNEQAAEFLSPEELDAADLPAERKRQMRATRKSGKRIGAICGSIMMLATIVGLVLLFVPGCQTPFFWLAWPIGGLLCGISTMLIKGFSADDE